MSSTPTPRTQRRARTIAMTKDELDAFLGTERTCRVATVGADGSPHVAPLWFLWDGTCVWLTSLVRSQRWVDLQRDPRVAVVVDAGEEYAALRGVEIRGTAAVVGAAPRPVGGPDEPHEQAFADKYSGGTPRNDGRHAWLRITPDKITSWDFRKLPAGRIPDSLRESGQAVPEG